MQKSIIFLLVGSLIMLLPYGTSMNIISKAMALNIDSSMNNDKQDYLQRYEKFYEDDSFREAYYNYHKQHHQLEPQQLQIENEVQESIDQKQQGQQNSMTESLPSQSISQHQRPSSISQEQMHQQQIVKLKQLLEAVR